MALQNDQIDKGKEDLPLGGAGRDIEGIFARNQPKDFHSRQPIVEAHDSPGTTINDREEDQQLSRQLQIITATTNSKSAV